MRLFTLAGGTLPDAFPPYHRREGDIILPEHDDILPAELGIEGHFLHTPGHTAVSVSIVVGGDAFVGDAARNMLRFAGAPYEPIVFCDRQDVRESWRKLLNAGVKTVYTRRTGGVFPLKDLKTSSKSRIVSKNHPFG
jgi:glyoxylase-like metal-dependent hydrolase (beta-lactamase superfamily II)